jgi:nitrogen fixation/metabolism regulation signal transduction histidine kinase
VSTATPAAAASPPKFKRSAKNYLLDRRFQLKYTGYIVALTVVVSAALGFLLYRQSDKTVALGDQTVTLGSEAVKVGSEANEAGKEAVKQSQSLTTIIEISADKAYGDNPTLLAAMKADNQTENEKIEARAKLLASSETKLKEQSAALGNQRNALAHQRTVLMATLGGVLLALVVMIGLAGIVVTHKIVGPIFKMKRLLREVGEGNFKVQGRLRKGDELQEFFEVFATMVENLRKRQAVEIEQLDAAIEAARVAGAEQSVMDKLTALRSHMHRELET